MNNKKPIVAIIGLGHLGVLLVTLLHKTFSANQLIFGQISGYRLPAIKKRFPDCVYAGSNLAAVNMADIVIIAVRPLQAGTILTKAERKTMDTKNKVFVSFMAAVSFRKLRSLFGSENVIKCAISIAAELGAGPVVYMPSPDSKEQTMKPVLNVLSKFGELITAEKESEIDHAIVSSGAVFALIIEHIRTYTDASMKMFKDRKKVRRVIAQTFMAAGQYCLIHEELSEQEIIDSIATKGGITAIMLEKLRESNISRFAEQAISAGLARMKEVIKMLNSNKDA